MGLGGLPPLSRAGGLEGARLIFKGAHRADLREGLGGHWGQGGSTSGTPGALIELTCPRA